MPRRALRPCGPGCSALVESGHCAQHQRLEQQHDRQRRGSAHARGYTKAWNAYSRRYRYEHPWCRPCQAEGRNTVTQAVDHITPVTGPDDPLFWDPSNHQSICKTCHSRKTVTTDQRGLQNAPITYTVDKTRKSGAWIA